LAVSMTIISFFTIKTAYINTVKNDLKNIDIALALDVKNYLINEEYVELDELIKNIGKEIDTRITIINNEGEVVADSEEDPYSMENHNNRPEIIGAIEKGFGSSIRYSKTMKEEMIYIATPLKINGEIIGAIRTSRYLTNVNSILNGLIRKEIQLISVIILFSFIIAYFLSKFLSNPIIEITKASKKVASGDLKVRVVVPDSGELKDLASNFNNMIEKLKNLVDNISEQKDIMNTVIESIDEGIILINAKGRIKIANSAFKKIINNDDIIGKNYWELLMSYELNNLMDKFKKGKEPISNKIQINNKYFIVNISLIERTDDILISLFNITDMEKTYIMKRDFIANVSHELRTPLTSIKGFIETLEEEVDSNNIRYVDIIKKHTERMIRVVNDLQILSKFEALENKIKLEKVDLKNIANNVILILRKKAERKGLELRVEIDDDVTSIDGDEFEIEQMLINLIENAIKYTEKGFIKLDIGDENNRINIEVSDTGIGIPDNDIDRIFERFYVVDKSRSRETGGTGLGLSIVKHIINSHNGDIMVYSKVGQGTKFVIHIPKTYNI
ncbi:HAMP domain-containing protein, partial [candidate division WOR-3 bacterium]|nr:HAMP domain-containing protein [candidate division WOR-3 bacterium]